MSEVPLAGPPAAHPPWLTRLVESATTVTARQISRFVPPADGSGRRSAVLILLADTGVDGRSDPSVVLIERASTLRKHAGQIAFPGGAIDPEDVDATAAALREAREEVGLDLESVEVIGRLPDLFLPVTSFVVTPVLAFWRSPHEVAAVDAGEVAGVTVVPIRVLVDPANRFSVSLRPDFVGPGFQAGELFVWGFTAGLLAAVLDLGGWSVPWDRDEFRPIPESVGRRT